MDSLGTLGTARIYGRYRLCFDIGHIVNERNYGRQIRLYRGVEEICVRGAVRYGRLVRQGNG